MLIVCVVELRGLLALQKKFGERVVSFLLVVPEDVRESRAKARGSFSQEEWDRRVLADDEDFSDVGGVTHYIKNVDVTNSVRQIREYLEHS